jgi:putative effector of murein hydrolase LrgA (UPF0299 family)
MDSQSIVNAVIAGLLIIGVFVLLALGLPVPEQIWSALLIVVGFYFGLGTGNAIARFRAR